MLKNRLVRALTLLAAALALVLSGCLYEDDGSPATPTDGKTAESSAAVFAEQTGEQLADRSVEQTAEQTARKYFADGRTLAYLRFIAEEGIRVTSGDKVVVDSPVENAPLAHMLAELCYERGAAAVHIIYSDDEAQALSLKYLDEDEIAEFDFPGAWSRIAAQGIKDFCYVRLDSATVFESDEGRLFAYESGYSEKVLEAKRFFGVEERRKWTIFACPTANWARCVYPELDGARALARLWEDVFDFARIRAGDEDCSELREHMESLERRTRKLNELGIYSLHYKSSRVDLRVKLHDYAVFASSTVEYGIINVPSEESFTMPDKFSADGTVECTYPLVYNGSVIEGIKLTLRGGRVVEWSARTNAELLDSLIGTDEGSHYLGEVALVSCDGAIAQRNTLYYLTLIDENASCHIALGNSYPDENLVPGTQTDENANYSRKHIDVMIGSPDLTVTATLKSGGEAVIIKDGKWAV